MVLTVMWIIALLVAGIGWFIYLCHVAPEWDDTDDLKRFRDRVKDKRK